LKAPGFSAPWNLKECDILDSKFALNGGSNCNRYAEKGIALDPTTAANAAAATSGATRAGAASLLLAAAVAAAAFLAA
jgi:hypothetical protein